MRYVAILLVPFVICSASAAFASTTTIGTSYATAWSIFGQTPRVLNASLNRSPMAQAMPIRPQLIEVSTSLSATAQIEGLRAMERLP